MSPLTQRFLMPRSILRAAALVACSSGAAEAQNEVGWHPVENIPGCMIWNPHPQQDETATWSGKCSAGKAEGKGTLIWRYRKDGKVREDRTIGTLSAGKFVGHRTQISADGTFRGDPDGRGVLVFSDGTRYEGEFRNANFHGRGVMTTPGGSRYEGEFRDGSSHGRGVFTLAGGGRFEGEFRDGKPAGAGTCTLGGRTGRCLYESGEIRWLD